MVCNTNREFEDTFNHLYADLGQENEVAFEENKENMKDSWHPRERFQVFKQSIQDDIAYVCVICQQTDWSRRRTQRVDGGSM